MIEIKAPQPYTATSKLLFLAGSIEMGKADNWQTRLVERLKNTDWTILNPRRDDWDSTWEQKMSNAKFREQVEWELQALEDASLIVMYFDPKTLSPISLLELGLFAPTGKLIVCCPDGYWRKGNVEIVCNKFEIPMVEKLEDLNFR